MNASGEKSRAAASCDARDDNAIRKVWHALDRVKDPCNVLSGHDLSIVDMGLINRVEAQGRVIEIGVTFTAPGCLFAYRIIEDMEDLCESLPSVREIRVIPEPFPLWDESRLSSRARDVYANKKARFGSKQIVFNSVDASGQDA